MPYEKSIDLTLPGASGGEETAPVDPGRAPALRPTVLPVRTICRIVRQVTAEMLMLASDRVQMRRDRRRANCHIRQIAMYVCHVSLGISLSDIGQAFGRDRTTVSHACGVVEDRRDDPAFDDFVSALERISISVFAQSGAIAHE